MTLKYHLTVSLTCRASSSGEVGPSLCCGGEPAVAVPGLTAGNPGLPHRLTGVRIGALSMRGVRVALIAGAAYGGLDPLGEMGWCGSKLQRRRWAWHRTQANSSGRCRHLRLPCLYSAIRLLLAPIGMHAEDKGAAHRQVEHAVDGRMALSFSSRSRRRDLRQSMGPVEAYIVRSRPLLMLPEV